MRRFLLAAGLATAGMGAAIPLAHAQSGDLLANVRAWQAHDARLLSLSWRLARANATFCRDTQFSIGLMLTDFHRFKEPARASAAAGVSSAVAIEAVASGSPAEAAGLRAGDTLLGIGSAGIGAPPARLPKGKFFHDLLHDRIDADLARAASVRLRVARPGQSPHEVTVAGQSVCRGRFALISSGTAAMSEGYVIRIAVQLMAEHSDDSEAATMLAHELAHNILGHVAENNAKGRNYLTVRRNEREADRLAPWLMANAGFDPAAAPRFIAAWGPRHSGGITRSQSHDSWQTRAGALTQEVNTVLAARAARPGQPLDWRLRLPAIQTD
jgi:hypothetical protein